MRAYVLTIEPPGGPRRSSIAQQLETVAFPWTFFEGVRRDDAALQGLYSPFRNALLSKRSVTPSELACYASHRAIWQQVVLSGEPYALVLEDDARIIDRAALASALAEVERGDFDLVKLNDLRPKHVVKRVVAGEVELVSHKMLASGTVGYVISAAAAARLLRRQRVFRPVDEDIGHAWEFGIDVWSVAPNPVDEAPIAAATSSIQGERQQNRRNRLRSLYGVLLQGRKRILTMRYQSRLQVRC